ncbi:unnamed protein product [Aspergillus oryzae]|nr:unnamed protein product [Aspergillus oryzae]
MVFAPLECPMTPDAYSVSRQNLTSSACAFNTPPEQNDKGKSFISEEYQSSRELQMIGRNNGEDELESPKEDDEDEKNAVLRDLFIPDKL